MAQAAKLAVIGAIAAIRLGLCAPADAGCYHIKLGTCVNPGAPVIGLSVKVRINGGAPLELLLDSGAQSMVLDRRTASHLGFTGGTDWDLVTPGAPAAVVKKIAADSIQVGDLTLRDIPILIVDRHFGDGIHGVLPLSLFGGFLVRLDLAGKSLDLMPYPNEQPDPAQSIPAVSNNRLLFLSGVVSGNPGYFLLDTGASYNAISRNVARQLNIPAAFASTVPVRGGGVALDAPLIDSGLSVRFGTREITMSPVVAVDFSTSSRYHGLEVAGLLGYPALCDSVLTINYRDSLVQIAGRTRRAPPSLNSALQPRSR